MQYLFMAIFVGLITAADQWLKFWVVENIPLHGQVDMIPGLFHLTYAQNTGAAFSAFSGMQWLFALVFAVFTAALVWEFSRKTLPFTPLERWCLVAVYGGGLANMIDRVRLGYVVDMFEVEFMDFAIFNVADCFITCGCILLIAHLLLVNRDFWKDEKKS